MSSRGAVPGSTAVKQEGNISREVSEGPRKEKEHHVGQLFPSMQHRAEIRGVQEDVPEPPSLLRPTSQWYYTRYRAKCSALRFPPCRAHFRRQGALSSFVSEYFEAETKLKKRLHQSFTAIQCSPAKAKLASKMKTWNVINISPHLKKRCSCAITNTSNEPNRRILWSAETNDRWAAHGG